MTRIVICENIGPDRKVYPWRCDIHDGVGHHGVGTTKAQALYNASQAWFEFERAEKYWAYKKARVALNGDDA